MQSASVDYYATIQERADCVVISYYYPSRKKPLQEVVYSFEVAVNRLEKNHFEVFEFEESSNFWHFVKHAKIRQSKRVKAAESLKARLAQIKLEQPF